MLCSCRTKEGFVGTEVSVQAINQELLIVPPLFVAAPSPLALDEQSLRIPRGRYGAPDTFWTPNLDAYKWARTVKTVIVPFYVWFTQQYFVIKVGNVPNDYLIGLKRHTSPCAELIGSMVLGSLGDGAGTRCL